VEPPVRHGEGRLQKTCPLCQESILADARKCKHCGEFLDGRADFGGSIVLAGLLAFVGLILQFVVTIDGNHLIPGVPIVVAYIPAAILLLSAVRKRNR
jgi:hypothetical protein